MHDLRASHEAQRHVRLLYQRAPEVVGCPDEQTLQRAVAERLGYDPFTPDAARAVRASFSLEAGALVARIQIVEPSGQPSGTREIRSRERSCADLGAAAALAMSIAIDPEQDSRAAADPRGERDVAANRHPVTVPTPHAPPQPPPMSQDPRAHPAGGAPSSLPSAGTESPRPTTAGATEPAPADLRWEPFATAAAIGAAGIASSRALGGVAVLGGGARWSRLAVAVEGTLALPEAAAHPANMVGRVHAFTAGLNLLACGSRSRLALCAVGAFDLTHGWASRYAWTSSTTLSSIGGGVRAVVDWPVGRRFSALALVEAMIYGRRAVLQVDAEPTISTPRVRVGLGVGLRFNFL